MKISLKSIYLLLLLISTASFQSCRDDVVANPADGNEMTNGEDHQFVTLRISPISTGNFVTSNVVEMIRTLRIIMLNEVEDTATGNKDTYIEFNRLIDFQQGEEFSGPGENASSFRYIFSRATVPGIKKFYLIANEASVPEVNFQTENQLPDGLSPSMKLSDFLNHYTMDSIPGLIHPDIPTGTGGPSGQEFEAMFKSLYFTPEYKNESVDGKDAIFLPYTAFYEGFEIKPAYETDGNKTNFIDADMYLVPAATKFRFEFRNFRDYEVTVDQISISGIASDMFLLPHVNTSDSIKNFKDSDNVSREMYWVDWLALVSKISQQYGSPSNNSEFNKLWGWISDYDVPQTAYSDEENSDIIDFADLYIQTISIDPFSDDTGLPGTTQVGVFYLPECRNLVMIEEEGPDGELTGNKIEAQQYELTFHFTSEGDGTEATRSSKIGNLGSLFRNTSVLIVVSMTNWNDDGAYAEIRPWDEHTTNGYLTEEEEFKE